jgi:hypothetical protein
MGWEEGREGCRLRWGESVGGWTGSGGGSVGCIQGRFASKRFAKMQCRRRWGGDDSQTDLDERLKGVFDEIVQKSDLS